MTHSFVTPLLLRASREVPTVLRPLGSVVADYIVSNTWEVVKDTPEDTGAVLGTVEACRVLLDRAAEEGIDWAELTAAGPEGMEEVYSIMFDEFTGDYSAELLATVGAPELEGCVDIVYFGNDKLLDQAWGPQALRTLMQHNSGCAYAVVKVAGLLNPASPADWAQCVVRKARLEVMGFENVPGTEYMFADVSYMAPEVPELLEATYAD